MWGLPVGDIMPLIGAVALSVGVIVFLLIRSKERIAKASAINQKSFEQLATDLKSELADIKEKVSSMEKMMKDVQ
jgi:hypothetical protein